MTIAIIVACAIAAGILLFLRVFRRQESPQDTYVCSECGERHCICHKEEEA